MCIRDSVLGGEKQRIFFIASVLLQIILQHFLAVIIGFPVGVLDGQLVIQIPGSAVGIVLLIGAYFVADSLDGGDVYKRQVYARLNLYFHIQRCRGKELVMDYEQPDYVLMDKVQAGPEGEARCV